MSANTRKDLIGFSNLKNHKKIYYTTKEKVPGKFEKQTPITIELEENCTLQTQAYSFKLNAENETKKSKELTKATNQTVNFNTYINCLNDALPKRG